MQLKMPVFEEPGTPKQDAKEDLEALVRSARKQSEAEGRVWSKNEESNLKAFYFASPKFLGTLTAGKIAWWLRRFLVIQDVRGQLIPFAVNSVQFDLLETVVALWNEGKPVRITILKARQFGLSTVVQGMFWFFMLHVPNSKQLTVAHLDDASRNVYEMARRFWNYMPFKPLLKKNSADGLAFSTCEGVISIDTAQKPEVKRSFTFQYGHLSELAFWPTAPKTKLSMMQTIHDVPRTIVVQESTANGVGGTFYNDYWRAKKGMGTYVAKFYPWHWHPEYQVALSETERQRLLGNLQEDELKGIELYEWTLEQVQWRRNTIADKCDGDLQKFKQEYPSHEREAFLVSGRPVFELEVVEQRRLEAERTTLLFRGFIEYPDGAKNVPTKE